MSRVYALYVCSECRALLHRPFSGLHLACPQHGDRQSDGIVQIEAVEAEAVLNFPDNGDAVAGAKTAVERVRVLVAMADKMRSRIPAISEVAKHYDKARGGPPGFLTRQAPEWGPGR